MKKVLYTRKVRYIEVRYKRSRPVCVGLPAPDMSRLLYVYNQARSGGHDG